MIQNPIWLITLIFVNFLDVVMVYFVSRSVLNDSFRIKRIKLDKDSKFFKISKYHWFSTKLSKLELALGVIYAVVIGFLWHILGTLLFMRIVVTIALTLFATLFSQRKIYDAFVIYIQFFLFAGFIQLLFVTIINLITSDIVQFLMFQIVTFIGIIILTRKYKINDELSINFSNKVFSLIQNKVIFKVITFIIFIFALTLLIYVGFNTDNNYNLLFLPILIIPFYGIWEVLNDFQKLLDQMKKENHDIRSKVRGLHASLQFHVGDNETLMYESLEIMRYLHPNHEPKKLKEHTYDDTFYNVAYDIMQKYDEEIKFYSTVDIKELHEIVSFADTIAMFVSLLNNAIEHGYINFLIHSDIIMTKDTLMMKMANASSHKTRSEMNKMFNEGYSTKPEIGRGYGLSNLKGNLKQRYTVNGFNADILADCYYCERYKQNYLSVLIYVIPEGKEPTIKDCRIVNNF